jgi:hypothetical protein
VLGVALGVEDGLELGCADALGATLGEVLGVALGAEDGLELGWALGEALKDGLELG